jgi:hypothetical protein
VSGLALLSWEGGPDDGIPGGSLLLTINDNEPLNEGPAQLINEILNPDPPAIPGMPTDAWNLGALQSAAQRGEAGETIINGIARDVFMLSLTGDLYDGLALRALPPPFGAVPVRALLVTEGDEAGNTVFLGLVLLDDLTVVPLPPALWLLGSGLAALGLSCRRRGPD